MGIKVIVEWKAKPGQRDELLSVIEQMMSDGPPMPGSLGATFYEAVEDPDMLVEIADWESAIARRQTARSQTSPTISLLGSRRPLTNAIDLLRSTDARTLRLAILHLREVAPTRHPCRLRRLSSARNSCRGEPILAILNPNPGQNATGFCWNDE